MKRPNSSGHKPGQPRRQPRSPHGAPDDRQTRWKFGQNFLVDPEIVRGICEDLGVTGEDWVIEIGPGQGALTRHWAPRARKLTAIEIDPNWVEKLKNKDWGVLEVLQGDATTIDIPALLQEHSPFASDAMPSDGPASSHPGKPVLAGNLPYNRAAPILFHFLPHLRQFLCAQFMVQYEVAKRICANPGSRDFGSMSVAVQNHAEAVLLRKIEPEAFRPRPKVWSATLKLTPRPEPLCADPTFPRFVETCFSQKRKKLANVLESLYGRATVVSALEALGVGGDARAEAIGVTGFAELLRRLGPLSSSGPSRRNPGQAKAKPRPSQPKSHSRAQAKTGGWR